MVRSPRTGGRSAGPLDPEAHAAVGRVELPTHQGLLANEVRQETALETGRRDDIAFTHASAFINLSL